MTQEQMVICELASIALWAARRLENRDRRKFTVESVAEQLAPIAGTHEELTRMYECAKFLLTKQDIR